MSEERLHTIVRGGLESLPLPSRFDSPSTLVITRKPRRRSLLVIGAAAVFLLTVLAVSPVGTVVVRAVAGWFISEVPVRETTDAPPMPEWLKRVATLQPGESFEAPIEGTSARQVYQAVTLSEISGEWPLPSYRTPDPKTTVILHSGSDFNGTMRGLYFNYKVKVGKTEHAVFYTYTYALQPRTQEQAAWDARQSVIPGDPATVKREKVLIKGQEATAFSTDGGKTWSIWWFAEKGTGSMSSDLPLNELVKIVDSIQNL